MNRNDVLRVLTMTREQATAAGMAAEWDRVEAARRKVSPRRLVDDVLAELERGDR